jgi:hypothetical protein
MNDVVYVAITLIFFALMIAYGRGCKALGNDSSTDKADL